MRNPLAAIAKGRARRRDDSTHFSTLPVLNGTSPAALSLPPAASLSSSPTCSTTPRLPAPPPPARTYTATHEPAIHERWDIDIPGQSIERDVLYVADYYKLYCFKKDVTLPEKPPRILWSVVLPCDTRRKYPIASIVLDHMSKRVIVGAHGCVSAFSPFDGSKVWLIKLGRPLRSEPMSTYLDNDMLYIASQNYVVCVGPVNGDIVWKTMLPVEAFVDEKGAFTMLTFTRDHYIAAHGSKAKKLFVLDKETGHVKASSKWRKWNLGTGAMVAENSMIGVEHDAVHELSVPGCQKIQSRYFPPLKSAFVPTWTNLLSPVRVRNREAFVAAGNHYVTACCRDTFKQLWAIKVPHRFQYAGLRCATMFTHTKQERPQPYEEALLSQSHSSDSEPPPYTDTETEDDGGLVASETWLFVTFGRKVFKLNINSGECRWRLNLPFGRTSPSSSGHRTDTATSWFTTREHIVTGTPFGENQVIFGARGALYGVSIQHGEILWHIKLETEFGVSNMVVPERERRTCRRTEETALALMFMAQVADTTEPPT